ncbi:MAG: class I SAM-dependent methyltransferase [Bdellovibrionales bacterium]|nr:class I SAM-dependent methyltransferase [Bdellovibrionales bacterium]
MEAPCPQFDLRPWHCPTCGPGEEREIGLRGGKHHRLGLGVETRIVRCGGCGLLYPNPFPVPRNPEGLYGDPEAYFSGHDVSEKWAAIRAWMEDLQRDAGRNLRILDVGSGRGEMVAGAREAGFSAEGLEFSVAMRRAAEEKYGVTLHPHSIEEAADLWPAGFDVVTLCAVLEHVRDPDSMIRAAARLLKPGGRIFLDVPNEPSLLTRVGNLLHRMRGNRAVINLSPTWAPFHVYGFNPRALRAILGKHGFRVDRVRVWAHPFVPPAPGWRGRIAALAATGINHAANWVGLAGNLQLWATKRGK